MKKTRAIGAQIEWKIEDEIHVMEKFLDSYSEKYLKKWLKEYALM
jgi:hypothetical protein